MKLKKGFPKVLHPNIHKAVYTYPEDYVTLAQAKQILKCKHPVKYVESEFNEDEQFAYCTFCQKDLTEDYLAKMPEPDYNDYLEQMAEMEVSF